MTDTDRPSNGWTLKSIYEFLREIDKRYEQQFQAQTDALVAADKRYEQRYRSQETAVAAALAAQEKAVAAALAAQKDAVASALTAQKDAVAKAELAADKRFDSFSATIIEKLDSLTVSRDTGTGKGLRTSEIFAYLIGAAGIAAVLYKATGH